MLKKKKVETENKNMTNFKLGVCNGIGYALGSLVAEKVFTTISKVVNKEGGNI